MNARTNSKISGSPSAVVRIFRDYGTLLKAIWGVGSVALVVAAGVRVIRSFIPVLQFWITKLVLDALVQGIVSRHADLRHLWTLVGLDLGLYAVNDMLRQATEMIDSHLGEHVTHRLSLRLMRHVSRVDLSSLEEPMMADRLERARQHISGRVPLIPPLLDVCQDVLTLIALSCCLIGFSRWLVPLMIAAVLPAFLGEGHLRKRTRYFRDRRVPERRYLDYLRYLATSLRSAKEVKTYRLYDHLACSYETVAEVIRSDNRAIALRKALIGCGLTALAALGYCGVYAVILLNAVSGNMSVGAFMFVNRAFSRARLVVDRLLGTLHNLDERALGTRDFFELLEVKASTRGSTRAIPAPRPIRDGFEFRNVSFSYAGSHRSALQNVSFRLRRAETVALVGENGAGKTTIIKLLAGFYEPDEGCILLDGIDLRDYDIEDLRQEIGIIFQDFMRYEIRVRDNVGFGSVDRIEDDSCIEGALLKSSGANIIHKLPRRLDQVVGRIFDKSVELSGGEWQKLALARAHIRNSQVLILDEPTKSMDARAEKRILDGLAERSNDRITVIISHRFSNVRMADRILVLAEGTILEEGTHDDLIRMSGRYAELFSLQASGYR